MERIGYLVLGPYKWVYRGALIAALLVSISFYVRQPEKTWLNHAALLVNLTIWFFLAWSWWRSDVMDEFERRAKSAIGSDANLMIYTARLQLQTKSIAKLNHVMRKYDIMNTPKLDLPPEAKELREILESQQSK